MKKALLFVLSLLLVSCLKNEAFKLPYEGYSPIERNDNWPVSSPLAEQMAPELIDQAFRLIYEDDRFKMARSLLVFRNGKLVAEAYPSNKADIDHLINIQSCTKSVTSLLTGIAIQKNLISSLDEKHFDIHPESFDSDERKRNITLYHALTMQTGLEFDNSKHTLGLYSTTANSAAYVLSRNRLYAPGLIMNYNDGAPQLVSKAIEVKSGKNFMNLLKTIFFPS